MVFFTFNNYLLEIDLNMKKTIKLNEQQLNKIISETIKNVLNEDAFDNIKSGLRGFRGSYNGSKMFGDANREQNKYINRGEYNGDAEAEQLLATDIQSLIQQCNKVGTLYRQEGRSKNLENVLYSISDLSKKIADIVSVSYSDDVIDTGI